MRSVPLGWPHQSAPGAAAGRWIAALMLRHTLPLHGETLHDHGLHTMARHLMAVRSSARPHLATMDRLAAENYPA